MITPQDWLKFWVPGQTGSGDSSSAVPSSSPAKFWQDYWVDSVQRSILFWDVLRERGNDAHEHRDSGKPPVLEFDYETLADGRDLERPVNYSLLRILPPEGVELDDAARPFVVIDPRAGHGPGIGGFKQDSQIGVALNAGNPCYFVTFDPVPVPGQTLSDVGNAEAEFLRIVAERHPEAPGKPAVIGNCQAGWAVFALSAVAPDVCGPICLNGAPLSYWSGRRGENPMRYTGGLLGGTWLASFAGDLGNGLFDGAHLVENFENLNPANTLWSKQYNLYSKVDTEAERFLGFERWWGGYFLMNTEEMRTITNELFVGNKLAAGEIVTEMGLPIDVRNIRSPIVLFASFGDNITPPQQALNWICDVYRDVDEIKANEQVIVYLLHEDIGHLCIFVSGRVARREHAGIVETLDMIDHLAPGLYEMVIEDKQPGDRNAELMVGDYTVRFDPRTIDDIRALDDTRDDEPMFEAVSRVSQINEGLYLSYLSPAVRAMSNDMTAEALRELHPQRLQRFPISDRNPAMAAVKHAADIVRANRRPVPADNPFVALERAVSQQIVRTLDIYRDARDYWQEQLFHGIYGSTGLQAALGLKASGREAIGRQVRDQAREALIALKKEHILARIAEGGFNEGVVRVLIHVVRVDQYGADAREFRVLQQLKPGRPELAPHESKALMKEQAAMLDLYPERAIAVLPKLLRTGEERASAIALVREVLGATGELPPARAERLAEVAEMLGVEEAPEPPVLAPTPARQRRPRTPRKVAAS